MLAIFVPINLGVYTYFQHQTPLLVGASCARDLCTDQFWRDKALNLLSDEDCEGRQK